MNTESGDSKRSEDYKVFFEPRAERDLERLSPTDFARVDQHILALEKHPRPQGVKKLGSNNYRIRVGSWRVIYVVDDKGKTVLISRIKRREKDTYRR